MCSRPPAPRFCTSAWPETVLKKLGGVVLLVAAVVVATRMLWPKEVERPAPPATADTVGVTSEELAEIQQAWFRYVPEEATSDERNQVDTLYRTRERVVHSVDTVREADTIRVVVARLPARWYLDTLTAPREAGDSARYALTWLKGRESGDVVRRDQLVRHPAPPGPIESVATDSSGLHVEYGTWEKDGGPGLLIQKLPSTAACAAEGIWLGSGEAALSCELGAWVQLGVSEVVGDLF